MIKRIRKYYLLLAAVVTTLACIFFYARINHIDFKGETQAFQDRFLSLEKKLDDVLAYKTSEIRKTGVEGQWMQNNSSGPVFIHVYRRDSLIYWNSNQLPILRFANIQFPTTGIFHLQNGWYYAATREAGEYLISASFLIKSDYAYQNEQLLNDFSPQFDLHFEADITLDQDEGFHIVNEHGDYVFSFVPDEIQSPDKVDSLFIFILLLGSILLWLLYLFKQRKKWTTFSGIIALILIIALRFASLYGEWFSFAGHLEAFDPNLFASNFWFPNFFEFTVNIAVLVYIINDLRLYAEQMKQSQRMRIPALLIYIISFGFHFLLLNLLHNLIEDSSIPTLIDQLFTLNIYSVIAITAIGVLFYAYYWLVYVNIEVVRALGWSGSQVAVITFFLGCVFFFYEITLGYQLLFASLFPLMFYSLLLYLVYRDRKTHQLSFGILILMLFAFMLASSVDVFNIRKEKGIRELYASQLSLEKNVLTEMEYSLLSPRIQEDAILQRFIQSPHPISISDFEDGMERRLFNGFWDRYDLKFYLFDTAGVSLLEYNTKDNTDFSELNRIIASSGSHSEIDSNIYHVHSHYNYYSYIIRQEITTKDSVEALLYCTLKSKKIPEEIGFPRLLISSDANVLEPLEAYSIAKYHESRLVTRYGNFNYPSSQKVMIPSIIQGKGFFDFQDYNHFVLKSNDGDLLVLSIENTGILDLITSFSYIFSFFGFLLLPLVFRVNSADSKRKGMPLSLKIQLGLISLVFLSLLTFGWGSGLFVSTQYNQFTNDMIREKLSSVESEIVNKLGNFKSLSIEQNGNYLQNTLQQFARIFFTDINMYDEHGYLLATSRPKVFNVGLLSEQMNPTAFKNMELLKQSEFVHQEMIGQLKFSSAYKPLYNLNGKQLGFINLQHFGQQREFENQIQRFLVAIINVFIFLLAVSVILAIFISNWLTEPLRILQSSFAGVRFGKRNQRIEYDKNDEIGSLVKDYNSKLEELEFAAQQLAKSERELAWREMAKQVAHEIKNPLTPMKLSIQQLLRVYDPNDPKSEEKLNKVAHSIIEQIDALTNIANEFSNFAKMPTLKREEINIVQLIEGVKSVFGGEALITIVVSSDEVKLAADKDQLVRVFNNLIKNAIQATPSERQPEVQVSITSDAQYIRISITDNGSGISEEQADKIFVPYFTTKGTGTGIGLAMVKQIIENHGGTIQFESQVGEGTTFTIVLPVK